jgi:hypothetical protein
VSVPVRARILGAWSLWLATLGCCAAGLVATLIWTRPLTAAVIAQAVAEALALRLSFATIGLILTLRRPANPIGWLYAAAGLVWSLEVPWVPWVERLVASGRPLPVAAQLVAVLQGFAWAPAIALGLTLPFLLLPDGRLRSPRWRVVVATAVTGAAMVVVASSLAPIRLGELPIDNPLGLTGPAGTAATVAFGIGLALHLLSLPAALASLVLRFRAASGVERQQLRWVAAGAITAVVGLLATNALFGTAPVVVAIFALTVTCVPGAVAVAVLRYRLWDLDRLVSRTVTYAAVTALLVVPYLLIVPAVSRLVEGSSSLAVAAATLAAAACFQPLRRRVQDLVDRRFNRRRYNAARTVEAFAARLREQIDLDALNAELLTVIDQTVQPTQVSLWLRPPAGPRPLR